MKLFERNSERIELNPETVEYLLNERGGGVLHGIRDLIANIYNENVYDAKIFSLMRSADYDHAELVLNIIEFCGLKYGDACFLMINDLAPKIIDRWSIEEIRKMPKKKYETLFG